MDSSMDNYALAVPPSTDKGVILVDTSANPLGIALVNPRKANKTSDCMDLVELATQVQMADEFVRATAGSKLTVIAEQIRQLQEQACQELSDKFTKWKQAIEMKGMKVNVNKTKCLISGEGGVKDISRIDPCSVCGKSVKILSDAKRDSELNHVACNLVKKPGHNYYLYQNETTGKKFLSLLSPKEWGSSCPHTPLGGYRLELDRSWTPLDSNDQPLKKASDLSTAHVNNILNARLAISDS